VIVRRERPADSAAVAAVHRAAFPTDAEARLVGELRRDVGFLPHLSLVAVDGGDLIGHVIATRGRVEPAGAPALGIGPVGVRPDRQRGGVGTVLVHALLAVAEAAGECLAVLLGSPDYYRRFGFRPATELGIGSPDPTWGVHFQARALADDVARGTFRYAEPFDRL
jgi:putative acetyltransferase